MLRRRYVVFVIDAQELGSAGLVLAVHRSFAKAERKAYGYSEYGRVGMIPTDGPIRCGDFVKFIDTCRRDRIKVSFRVGE